MRGNIRVFCRVRPLLNGESDDDVCVSMPPFTNDTVQLESERKSAVSSKYDTKKEHTFNFDRVFGPESTQADVFGELSALVQSACDGFNVTVFAYGATGSGELFVLSFVFFLFEKQRLPLRTFFNIF